MVLPFSYRIKGQQLWLSADRCIFWEEEKALIVSDLHFGKTGHFRKSGIAIPPSVYKEDLQRLVVEFGADWMRVARVLAPRRSSLRA